MRKRLFLVALVCGATSAAHAQTRRPNAPLPPAQSAARAIVDAATGNARAKRDGARALKAQSDKLAGAGDYSGAMELRLQMLDYDGASVSTLGALTFYAIQDLALGDIAGIASHLDAPASRKYAAELMDKDAKLFSLIDILRNQKAAELKNLAQYTSSPVAWRGIIASLGIGKAEREKLAKTPVAQIKSNIEAFYDEGLARAAKPYAAQVKPYSGPLDPYSYYYATPYIARRFSWARAKTERLLLIAALQDRADRLEKVARTAPLPPDPFGEGPLRERDGMIYSVGPDTLDDGGASVPDPKRVQAGDKGDVLEPLF